MYFAAGLEFFSEISRKSACYLVENQPQLLSWTPLKQTNKKSPPRNENWKEKAFDL